MNRFINSLQSQLYIIVLLLAVLVAAAVYLDLQLVARANAAIDVLDVASLQRSNAYLLASVARRYSNARNDTDRESIGELLNSIIANVRQIQEALRGADEQQLQEGTGNRDENLDIQAITRPEIRLLLDDLDSEWTTYLEQVEAVLTVDEAEASALLERIDRESVTVFTVADHLVRGLDVDIEQQQAVVQQIAIFIAIVTALAIVAAVAVVTRIVRSVNRLSVTARTLADGNLAVRASEESLVEIAAVGQAFNTMANRLGVLISQLEDQIVQAETARKAAERSDQVKSAFLASMSHELRTPLNSVINFSKFVVRGVMGPVTERQIETLNKVIASAHHLLDLINDVLDMSKIESGSLNLFIEDDINPNSILKDVLGNAEGLLSEKTVSLVRDIQPDLPIMRGDRKRITQIYLNVISNACKFTQTGFVKIHAHAENGEVQVSVQDSGPGIAPEDREAVFEPFKQTHAGLRQGEGTGLGLPISKSLTEAHGGRLWFTSDSESGTTFFIALPVKSETLQPVS